jgi:hypothetical protein
MHEISGNRTFLERNSYQTSTFTTHVPHPTGVYWARREVVSAREDKDLSMSSSKIRKRVITAGLVVGAVIGSAGIANALTGSTTTPPPASTVTENTADVTDTGTGVDTSNTDPAHEAAETPAVAAQEAAGNGHGDGDHGDGGPGDGDHGDGDHGGPGGPGGDHHSNTDAAHEAAESPERAAQEAADDAATTATTVAP